MKKIKRRVQQTNKALQTFIKQTLKNYQSMKKKLAKIWCIITLCIVAFATTNCNVTRTITNESQYYQKGDTSVVIQTKTIETYNAEKK